MNYYFNSFFINQGVFEEVEKFFIQNPKFSIHEFTSRDYFDDGVEHNVLIYKK